VLSLADPWIPADMEPPRRGAVPVRFFGTYNFAWIESQRALGPWGEGTADERASKGKGKVLQPSLSDQIWLSCVFVIDSKLEGGCH
jgi:hypothetical protein